MPFLHPDTHDSSRLGGKAAALARFGALGFEIPAWFAVPPDADWSPAELSAALAAIGPGPFAVRSSGLMEDGAGHSFAGQFESHLDISPDDVPAKIAAVRASASGPAILAYCRERDLPEPPPPTVLVQRMIAPRTAGVAFSADPVTGRRDTCVVSAVAGTGEKLVSGETDGETWRVAGQKTVAPESPSILTAAEAAAITALALRCQTAAGSPQDIEWAIDTAGALWLLQSRPITTLALTPDPADALRVWDNSNIAESYGGVTTPLTFSFARRIYEHVYREFCRLMSVPKARIDRADEVFPQMLALIRGRTYYNLASWYRVLALLPGFQLNRAFMEQMMGVKEPLPAPLVQAIVAESRTTRLGDTLALAGTCAGLVRQLLGLKKQIARFQTRLDHALRDTPIDTMSGEQLVAAYRDLERRLLKKWDAPLVNDFFAMIYYGVLRSLCGKWAGDTTGTLQNDLLARTGGIISAEPPRRIIAMARIARDIPGLPEKLADPSLPASEKRKIASSHPALETELHAYLRDFGDRCLEELKLESPTVGDDPSTLLSSIGILAASGRADLSAPDSPHLGSDAPHISNPLKRFIFRHVLRQARERVRCRENLRFERTRLFGRVRAIVRRLGHHLHADGLLVTPADVFHLELGEILSVWETTGATRDLAALARQRRAEFDAYKNEPAPPDRFQTHGPLHRYAAWPAIDTPHPASASTLQGAGACPGIVRGRVRLVLDPRGASLQPGEILVTLQTDPGWVVLFPAAAGLLVERGSLLSHSAIVSRELRLPCIVSLPHLTRTLKSGDLVEMNGATGLVRILDPNTPENPASLQKEPTH